MKNKLYFAPIEQPKLHQNDWSSFYHWRQLPNDRYIVLTEPLIKHYADTIFYLGAPALIESLVDQHFINEKVSGVTNMCYKLPDGGNGLMAEIPLEFTLPIPDHLIWDIELCSGPARISSIHWINENDIRRTKNLYPIPDGHFPVELIKGIDGIKNILCIHAIDKQQNQLVKIIDCYSGDEVYLFEMKENKFSLSLSSLNPGFYQINIFIQHNLTLRCTFIKLFPVIILPGNEHHQYFTPTIW